MPTKKIYTNTIAQIGSKLITAVISIGLIGFLTRYLDISDYGIYSKIYNYLSIFAVIADLGLYTITVREISGTNDEKKREKMANTILTLRTLMGIGIIFLSIMIAFFLPGYNDSSTLIAIGVVAFFTLFGLIQSSLMSYLQAILRTEFSLISNTSGKLLTFLIIAALSTGLIFSEIPSDKKIIMVCIAGLLGNMLMTGLTYFYSRKFIHIRFQWDSDYIHHIVRASLPYGVALFLGVIFFKVDVILLSLLEPRGQADISIALYSVPMKIIEVGMMYGTIFLNSLLPVLTGALARDDRAIIEKITLRGFELLVFFGVGISGALFTFHREILHLIAGEDYLRNSLSLHTSSDAMQIVAWIFLIYFISSLSTYIMIARGQQAKMLAINAIVALMNIIGNILIIPYYSFIGSAWITLLSQVILLILTTYQVRDILPLRRKILFILILMLALMLSMVGTELIREGISLNYWEEFSLLILIFGSIYMGIVGLYIFLRNRKIEVAI